MSISETRFCMDDERLKNDGTILILVPGKIGGHGKMVRRISGIFVEGQNPGSAWPDISSVEDPVNMAAVCFSGKSVKSAGWTCCKHLFEPVGLKGLESG